MVDENGRPITYGEFTFLREQRERRGLSIEEVAKAIGMDAERYAIGESDPMTLYFDDAVYLSEVLGFKLVDFGSAMDRYVGWDKKAKPRGIPQD